MVTVHRAAVRGVDPGPYDRRQLDAWDHDRDPDGYPFGDPDRPVVVAERDARTVGFGWANDREGEVEAVYVHPDHAGDGVGSTLLAHLEGRLAAVGVEAVEVLASLNAVPFYRRAGYEHVGERPVEFDDGVELSCARMVKDLRGPDDGVAPGEWGRLPA